MVTPTGLPLGCSIWRFPPCARLQWLSNKRGSSLDLWPLVLRILHITSRGMFGRSASRHTSIRVGGARGCGLWWLTERWWRFCLIESCNKLCHALDKLYRLISKTNITCCSTCLQRHLHCHHKQFAHKPLVLQFHIWSAISSIWKVRFQQFKHFSIADNELYHMVHSTQKYFSTQIYRFFALVPWINIHVLAYFWVRTNYCAEHIIWKSSFQATEKCSNCWNWTFQTEVMAQNRHYF